MISNVPLGDLLYKTARTVQGLIVHFDTADEWPKGPALAALAAFADASHATLCSLNHSATASCRMWDGALVRRHASFRRPL